LFWRNAKVGSQTCLEVLRVIVATLVPMWQAKLGLAIAMATYDGICLRFFASIPC
jgi:hypothetical protein